MHFKRLRSVAHIILLIILPFLLESFSKKFGPLMVAFVGIPARGKTVMAHKLARYLNWTGELAKGKKIT